LKCLLTQTIVIVMAAEDEILFPEVDIPEDEGVVGASINLEDIGITTIFTIIETGIIGIIVGDVLEAEVELVAGAEVTVEAEVTAAVQLLHQRGISGQ